LDKKVNSHHKSTIINPSTAKDPEISYLATKETDNDKRNGTIE
jgi:hypothetical protein